jgi:hypothetical protein
MGWDSIGSRLRAVERAVVPSGPCVIIEYADDSPSRRAVAAAEVARAEEQGRDVVIIFIGISRSPG